MTLQELEQKLLCLSPMDKLHIIQILAQSLNVALVNSPPPLLTKLSEFFRQSPLAEVGDLDLLRDRSLLSDRIVL